MYPPTLLEIWTVIGAFLLVFDSDSILRLRPWYSVPLFLLHGPGGWLLAFLLVLNLALNPKNPNPKDNP